MPIYSEIFNGPARSYRRDSSGRAITSWKRYITIHNTSNDATAEGEASYAKVRTDGTSSHYYVDSDSIVQSLNTDWCAGHVGSLEGNTYGISYEITGFNGWTREQWLSNVAWELLAKQVARDCTHFGIPVCRLTVAEMKTKTMAGFITHNDARLAWGATTHTDPGPGFPMDHLLARVADLIGDDVSWQENLTAGADAGGKTYPAKDWLIGTNMAAWMTLNTVNALAAAEQTRDAAMIAAIQALAGGGGPDAAPIIAAIQAEAAATRALVEEKHNAEMAELRRAFDAEKAGLVAELERLNAAAS